MRRVPAHYPAPARAATFRPVRQLLATALVLALVACGRSDRAPEPAAHGAPSASLDQGSDLLVLRLPRDGGAARVFAYPKVDSLVWQSSESAPAVDRVLGFDDDGGTVAFIDSKDRPGWLDLRQGSVTIASRSKLSAPISLDGSTIYGTTDKGEIQRFTATGDWKLVPPRPARALFPQGDGSLIFLASDRNGSIAWRVRPPETGLVDTASLPPVRRVLRIPLGDRIYFLGDGQLVGLRTRNMEVLDPIELEHGVTDLVATPSGDRLFLADSTDRLAVVDRYRGKVSDHVQLPGIAREVRMDPDGRYLLARAVEGDSAWVVALGTNRVIGAVRTTWRVDLPYVAPDGGILLADGKDVSIVDGETLRERARVRGGTADFWYAFSWNGFRRPAQLAAEPAPPPPVDSAATTDSLAALPPAPSPTDTTQPPPGAQPKGFTVSFAALLSEDKAKDLANQITVAGQHPRIVTSVRDGTTIFRVILGPYPTRADADRVGHASGTSYWVYEGAP